MNTPCCCPKTSPARPTYVGRAIGFLSWFLPSAVLAVLPKCPMCLAAWLSIATGIGLSMTAASYLRTGLIVACVASLLVLATRRLTRLLKGKLAHSSR